MSAPVHFPPLVRSYVLLQRMRASAANVFRHATALLLGWVQEEAAFRNRAALAAAAIDDPLETLRPRLELALRNDPPAVRRAILAAVDEVHARTTAQAAALRVQLPLDMGDGGTTK